MKISLSQIEPKLSKNNEEKHITEIEFAKKIGSNVIIFPELSLNGYNMMDLVFEDAYTLEELNLFLKMSHDIDIVLGLALREKHKIYNSAIYFSKGEIKNIYHKNTLPNYGMFQEARFFFSGDNLEEFETDFGSVMCVICEDLWNIRNIEKIVEKKPDFVYVLSASPARGFRDDGLEIEKKWQHILSTTAILSGTYVLFCNRVGFEDGLGFWGGSRAVNPKGNIEKKAILFKEEHLQVEISKQLSNTQKYLLRISE